MGFSWVCVKKSVAVIKQFAHAYLENIFIVVTNTTNMNKYALLSIDI